MPPTPAILAGMDLDVALDLDAACAALARARLATDARRVVARHADLWRHALGRPLDPLDAVLPIGALSHDALALCGLLVDAAHEVESMRAIAAAHPDPLAVFVAPAAALGPRLPPAVVIAQPIRQEELLRRWANHHGAGVRRDGRAEPAEHRRRVLDRLDYRRIRAEEERLDAQRTIAEARRAAMAKVAAGGAL